jgi:hypothetical protein
MNRSYPILKAMTTDEVMDSMHRKVLPIQNPAWCAVLSFFDVTGEPRDVKTPLNCRGTRTVRASAKSTIHNGTTHFHHLDIQHPDSLVDSEMGILIDVGILLPSSPQQHHILPHL